ncbi:hypothetical protein F5887DRAFT_913384 [Amanita rubescens]|nr:hypothetical protein F5887DRAFT_913384 [Amanita rubescens]
MSALQSNQLNPLYPSSHIVLPPYLMYGMETRTFWCAVYGSSRVFKMSAHPDIDVDDLKKDIIKQEIALRHLAYSNLVLWKLSIPESADPEGSFWQRIRKRGDMETFAEELKISRQKMSEVFPQSQLREDHVHILVELPSNDSRSWLAVIHGKLWKEHEFFGKIFRTANLTEHDFKDLQDLLDKENPGRTSDSYVVEDVLAKKSDFLREKSKPLEADFGDCLVPRLVFDAIQPPFSGIVGNDAVFDDDDAMDIDPNHGYCCHMHHLSKEAKAIQIFPYTIWYVDLTVLKLKNNLHVPLLMLFRNEWGMMIDIFNERKHLRGIRGSAIFTGQPGIGKMCLLYSILILCMIRGQRCVFQDMDGKVFIIDDAGVNTPEDVRAVSGDEVLTLVDDSFKPVAYLQNNSNHRILLTSSPRSRTDRGWLKQYAISNAVFTMNPWSREELVVATLFLQMTDITLKRLQQASLICGNIPRPCFEAAISLTDLREAENVIKKAIEDTKDLFEVTSNMQNGDDRHITHRVFQVHPKSSENRFWHNSVAKPVSAWAFFQMLNVLHKRNRGDAYRFYCTVKAYPESSQLRGNMFEYYLHPYLKRPRTFNIKSLDDGAATLKIDFIVNADNHLSFTDLSEGLVLSVKSNKSHYLRPGSPVFPSFDSFLYQPEISHLGFSPLIALQVTTAAKHEIKLKGLKDIGSALQNPYLESLRPEQNRKMIVLFVVPDDLEPTFRTQKIHGAKKEVGPWYNKTTQYVLGLPVQDLFEFHEKALE